MPIYLNNAATAWPKAPGVPGAVAESLSNLPEDPGRTAARGLRGPEACRTLLARLIGAESPGRVVLTRNATHALNLAVLGAGLKQGDEVVTSVAEHNSVLRPLARLEEFCGVRVTLVPVSPEGGIDEDSFDGALSRGPKLVVLNHVSNVTGRIAPVASLFARARRAGALTLLDASQSLGHIPVDAEALSADMIAFTGHKGLRGPQGTGGLSVRSGLELEQVIVGGTGVRSDLRLHPEEMPLRLEAGTPDLPSLAGLETALRWRETQGASFDECGRARAVRLRSGLESVRGVRLFCKGDDSESTGIVSFRVDGLSVAETGYALAESFGIVCRTGLHCAPLLHAAIGSAPEGTVRFSPSGATAEEEIEEAIDAVRRLAECGS